MCQMERKSQTEENLRKFPTLMKWDHIRWREEKIEGKKKKRKKKECGVRSSTFSLRSTEIRPSSFIRGRGKVHLRNESFA